MAYCTAQQMIDRFGEEELIQLTDRTGVGDIDAQVLDQAIQDAGDEIDTYLEGRYRLPLQHVPGVLVRIACDIARYYLYEDAVTDNARRRYEDAVKFLSNVASGRVSLGLDTTGDVPQTAGGAHMISGGRVFGRDDRGFV